MKTYINLAVYTLITGLLLAGCNNNEQASDTYNEQADTVVINNPDTGYTKPVDVSAIPIDTNLVKAQVAVTNKQMQSLSKVKDANLKNLALENLTAQLSYIDAAVDTTTSLKPNNVCVYPSTIRDLKDGISLQAYDFKKGEEYKLGLMGFLGVDIQNDSKITIVEFSQSGSVQCEGKILPYGIGARLMLQVIKKKRNAKLETPQQITASVIFDRTEVKYSVKTFGITGPKTASLVKSGILSENTYNDFINAMADMIVDAYKGGDNGYVITPLYMPLKQ